MNIVFAIAEEVEAGCFIVSTCIGKGRFLYHEGPKDYAFFTKEEAERLARRVSAAKVINPAHWWDGVMGQQCDAEWEHFEREAGRAA